MKQQPQLPSYAYPERSPRADGERDLLASFYGDDNNDTITVWIERCEAGTFNLLTTRSGITESRFSKKELGRVLEVAAALFSSL